MYNASAFDVDTQAVKNTYLFLEKISKTPVQVSSFKKPNGEDRISFFVVRDSTKRDMFVIDPSKPRPNWSKLTSDANIASGASFTNPKEVQSFVSVDPAIERAYKSPAESISAVFLTEACQSTIEAFVMDPKTKTIDPDHQLKLREQEYICNSFSIAMFAKMQGLDYAGYLEYAGQQFITAPGVGLVGAKPSAIPESIYSSMPTNLQALK